MKVYSYARFALMAMLVAPLSAAASLPAEAPVSVAADAAAVTEALALPPLYIEKPISLKPGQALAELLQSHGFTGVEANAAAQAMRKHYNPSRLKPGEELLLTYKDEGQGTSFAGLQLHTPNDKTVTIRPAAGKWQAEVAKRELVTKRYTAVGTISDSLFVSSNRAGLSDRLTMELIDIFSFEYDFSRDLSPGDTFKVVFERIYTPEGQLVRTGNILAASLDTRQKDSEAFRGPNGVYYGPDGMSKERMLLKYPLKFTRISSGFNLKRRHPVLGFTRAHRGTDFAAPTGTPVKSSGHGRIAYIGWKGGYGKYIRVRHNATYQTAYAHLSRFAKGMRVGTKVNQGQVIGFVGTTGMSSGPHLHYEVHVNNRQVDPMRAKLPVGIPLDRKHRPALMELVAEARAAWQNAPMEVAELKKPEHRAETAPAVTPAAPSAQPQKL